MVILMPLPTVEPRERRPGPSLVKDGLGTGGLTGEICCPAAHFPLKSLSRRVSFSD